MAPLLFTPDVMTRAARPRHRHALGLLERWATKEGDVGSRVRDQLERVAAQVPQSQRGQVLAPILSPRTDEPHVRNALGLLMLAHTFKSTGWEIDFNPVIDGLTPDLLIRKGDAEFVVEVTRVTGRLSRENASDAAYRRIHQELEGKTTRTPISLRMSHVDGKASLKPFVRELEALLVNPPVTDDCHTISYEGVTVMFDIADPFETPFPMLLGGHERFSMGSESDLIVAAVEDKVHKYKHPLIVALDLVGLGAGFNAVSDALAGTKVFRIPVNLEKGGGSGAPSVGRLNDATLTHERLLAVLAFEWRQGLSWLHVVEPRLFVPLGRSADTFRDFAPIPIQNPCGEEPSYWGHTP